MVFRRGWVVGGLVSLAMVLGVQGAWADISVAAGMAVVPVGVWQALSARLVARVQQQGLEVQAVSGGLRVSVPVEEVFVGPGRDVRPEFEGFLADLAQMLQGVAGAQVRILGFGNIPAQTYNPVELGLRLRRVRSTLATYGLPMGQMKAALRPEAEYQGPGRFLPLVARGGVIALEFGPGV